MAESEPTYVVLMLGYPGVGKRTVGAHLAELLEGVLIDNQLVALPIFSALSWTGQGEVPSEAWHRIRQIRDLVLGTIEDLAPKTASYVFTKVLEDTPGAPNDYALFRSLAERRGSLFLAVVLDCEVSEQAKRVDTQERIQRRKWSDPKAVERYRREMEMFRPPADEVLYLDTTEIGARENAQTIFNALRNRMAP